MTSPFETLGILPSLVSELDESRLAIVAKAAAKGLQAIFHPDKQHGDAGRSVLINHAASLLSIPLNIKDYRSAYLEEGPGQREIREAEIGLLTFQHRLAGLRENIEKTKRSVNDSSVTDDILGNWARTIYSRLPGTLIPTSILYSKLLLSEWGKESDAAYLRYSVGTVFCLRPLESEMELFELVQKLEQLKKESNEKDDEENPLMGQHTEIIETTNNLIRWKQASGIQLKKFKMAFVGADIKPIKGAKKKFEKIKAESKFGKLLVWRGKEKIEKLEKEFDDIKRGADATPGKDYERDIAVARAKLDKIQKERKMRKEEIAQVESRIESLKADLKKCAIDGDRYIIIDGVNTGQRIAGTVSNPETDDIYAPDEFHPFLIDGNILVGALGKPDGKGSEEIVLHKPGVVYMSDACRKVKEAEKDLAKKRSRRKQKSTVREITPAHSEETALAKSAALEIAFEKNPFETLGIMPSLVEELPAEELRNFVKILSRAIMEVTHPDKGGHAASFKQVSETVSMLEQPEMFEKTKKEYGASAPGAGRIKAIQNAVEIISGQMLGQIKILTEEKVKAAQENAKAEDVKKQIEFFRTHLKLDLFGSSPHPEDSTEAVYLHHSSGVKLTILTSDGSEPYRIEVKGFDVLATPESGKKDQIRLIGSTPPDMFKSIEESEEAISIFIELMYENIQPILSPGSFLVVMKKDCPSVFGQIESIDIDKGKKVAREIGERIKKEEKIQRKERKPLKR